MMKRNMIWALSLTVACSSLLYLTTARTHAQKQTQSVEQVASPQQQPERFTGTPGTATKSAVVSFSEMAQREKQRGLSEEAMEEEVDAPWITPQNLPVPAGVPVQGEKLREDSKANGVDLVSPPLVSSFQASTDTNWIPPDTMGAVGRTHLIVGHNGRIRIQTRAGANLMTVTLVQFFASVNATTDVFDPKAQYDPYAKRWMLTASANRDSAASAVLIGVSQGEDPTGLWNLYSIDADATNQNWADYPSIGFNKDWIVVSMNMFALTGTVSAFRANLYVFKKANLYAALPANYTLISNTGIGGTLVPVLTYNSYTSALYVLQDWNGNSGGSGFVRLYTITGAIGSEVLTAVNLISTPNPWGTINAGGVDFEPQLGTTQKIQANDSRMQSAVFRNGTIWGTHSVFLPATGTPTRTAVQWWQLSTTGVIKQFGRIDDPSSTLNAAFPSIAVNRCNCVMLGYSRFTGAQFAAGYYSFRAGIDPPNTLRDAVVLKAGENPYFKTFGGARNRWGDYSNTVIDPLNQNDMWTIQEYAATPVNQWGTWWGRITSTCPWNYWFDTDGDLRTDFRVFRGPSGTWFTVRSSDGMFLSQIFGTSTDLPTPSDFDGDGKIDIAVFRPSNGTWYVSQSSDGAFTSQPFGQNGDLPIAGDYDGDSSADLTVFRPGNGTWYILNSSDGSVTTQPFGTSGDKPVRGDFDGDGLSDVAVYRPSNGTWYALSSSDGHLIAQQFGVSTDIPVPADFDGDGTTDFAVFRGANGTWYISQSSNNALTTVGWGLNGDVTVPGDYDGDGKADVAVWRPSNGTWYILRSSNNALDAFQFGTSGDVPAPSAYIR